MAIQKADELAKAIEEVISDAYCGYEGMPFQKALIISADLIRADRKAVIEECKAVLQEMREAGEHDMRQAITRVDCILRELD